MDSCGAEGESRILLGFYRLLVEALGRGCGDEIAV